MRNYTYIWILILFITFNSISSQNTNTSKSVVKTNSTAISPAFAKGADIGWLAQMEATGYQFRDVDGSNKDCLQLLKDRGTNTIRLRVWVNPSNDKVNGHCNTAETVLMAVRAQNLGMRIMIDFHYSDSWADPGKQTKPAAWANHSFSELLNDVYTHTSDVLTALKTAGVTPEWVQIGNEIPGGILLPEGSSSNWAQLAQLLNKGYEATKAIDPAIKVIVHVDQGNNNARFRWFFDNAKINNVKYDVIGLSYYPYWLNSDYKSTIVDLQNNLKDVASRYAKEVMVVEVGGDYTLVQNTYDMLVAVISAVKAVPNNKGLGVVYWEPEGEKSWSGYQLNAWQSDGKPSPALDAFKEGVSVIIEQVKINGFLKNPIEQGSTLTANLTYTSKNATNYFYAGVFKRNSSGAWLQTIVQSTDNQFLVPAIGSDNSGQLALDLPSNTIPTKELTNGEYYDLTVELWTENWGTKLGSSLSSKLTVAAAGSLGLDTISELEKLEVYPNPVGSILNFKNTNEQLFSAIKITNLQGKTVYSDTHPEPKNAIDVSNLSSGMYLLSLSSADKIQLSKFYKK